MRKLTAMFTFAIVMALSQQSFASSLSKDFNFDGFLADSSGNPMVGPVAIKFQIFDPSESCLLYEESHSAVALEEDGSFSVKVGTGTRQPNDPGIAWATLFQNSASPRNCYSPASGHGRMLKVSVNGTALTPSYSMSSVPMATVAETLQGKVPSDFIAAPTAAGSSGYVLSTNGAGVYSWVAQAVGGVPTASAPLVVSGSNISMPYASSTTDGYLKLGDFQSFSNRMINVTPGSNGNVLTASGGAWVSAAPSFTLPNVGTAGTYAKVTTDAQGRVTAGVALSPSDIPNIDATKITSGVIPLSQGGTGASTAGAARTALGLGDAALKTVGASSGNLVELDGSAKIPAILLPAGVGDFMANGAVTMTGNIRLGSTYLSSDGGSEGIRVSPNGEVSIGNGVAPDNWAILKLDSNDKGFMLPQLDNSAESVLQSNLLGAPHEGMMIYNTEQFKVRVYANGNFEDVGSAAGGVAPSRQVMAGTGLTGGGDLTTDRTLSVAFGSAAGTVVQGNDSRMNPVPGTAYSVVRVNSGGTAYEQGPALGTMATETASNYLDKAGNLFGLANPGTARTNLGLTSAANATPGASGNVLTSDGTNWSSQGLPIATSALNGLMNTGAGLVVSSGEVTPDFGMGFGQVTQGNDVRLAPAPIAGDAGKFVRVIAGGGGYEVVTLPASVQLGGNTNNAPVAIGTNDSYPLELKSNNVTRMRIEPNGNIGFGTIAPAANLHVSADTPSSSGGMLIEGAGTYPPMLTFRRAQGSLGVPGAVASNDPLMKIAAYGWDGGTYVPGAMISAIATQGFSAGYGGSAWAFSTTPNGTATPTERMRIDSSGTVGIGTSTPNTSAILDLSSINKGILIPRMTNAQKGGIGSPPDGLLVYTTDAPTGFQYYSGSGWKPMAPQGDVEVSNGTDITSIDFQNGSPRQSVTLSASGGALSIPNWGPDREYTLIVKNSAVGAKTISFGGAGCTYRYNPVSPSVAASGGISVFKIHKSGSDCLVHSTNF
ncbi:MAG: hypothetical protein AB7H97_07545 [Pseudobdellovibrionaceae bacterium]